MAFCRNCGKELGDDQTVCTGCGAPAVEEIKIETSAQSKKKDLNIGMLVWSLINLVLCSQVAAGVIALIFTLLAKGETDEKSARYNKIAKIANIVGTICAAVLVLFLVVFYIFMIILAFGMAVSVPTYYY